MKRLILPPAALLVLMILTCVVLAPSAQAGLLTVDNGSFEVLALGNTLAANGGYFCQLGLSCVSNVTGWTSTCQTGGCGSGATPASLIIGGTGGTAFNGNIGLWNKGTTGLQTNVPVPDSPVGGNYIAFDGDVNYSASISQQITGLTVGQTYLIQFYQAAAQQKGTTGATTERWQVSFGSQTKLSTKMNNADQGWLAWNQQVLSFVADSTTDTLTFLAVGTPTGLPPVVLLDGITLTPAPEPQTMVLIGLGLMAIPALGRLQRRRAVGGRT